MNRLKSIFISTFVALLSLSLLHACIALDLHGLAIGWLGVVVGSLSNLAFLYWLDVRDSAQTRTQVGLLLLLTAVGALLAVWGAIRPVPAMDRLPPWYAVTVLLGTALYEFWYARTSADRPRVRIARSVQSVVIKAVAADTTVTYRTSTGKSSELLIIRSNLCPLCVAQVLFLDTCDDGVRRDSRSDSELPHVSIADRATDTGHRKRSSTSA